MNGQGVDAAVAATAGQPPRRVKAGRTPGVYYREPRPGRRSYEVSYVDSDGRRRWKAGFPTERAAKDFLADVTSRRNRGERIAPSRKTLAEVTKVWLAAQTELRPRTRERYENALDCHVLPRLGRTRISDVTVDHVADLIASMRKGVYFEKSEDGRRVRAKRDRPAAGWTIRATLTPLSRVMAYAVRRGWAATNPVKQLDRGERPSPGRRDMRVLQDDEIRRLLAVSSGYRRALLATAVFTGLRLSELLGLVWADIDLENGFVRVRKQLARGGERVEPKTKQAKRDVVLMPELARILREHRIASGFSQSTTLSSPRRRAPHATRGTSRSGSSDRRSRPRGSTSPAGRGCGSTTAGTRSRRS
jgi:integrase